MLKRILTAATVAAALLIIAPTPATAAPNCDVPSPPPICEGGDGPEVSPWAAIASIDRVPAGIVVTGTAGDPDGTRPVTVVVTADVNFEIARFAVAANGSFTRTLPTTPTSTLCFTVLNQNKGVHTKTCTPFTTLLSPYGSLDAVTAQPVGYRVRGWSIDPDTASPVTVGIRVDNGPETLVVASVQRPDVGAAYPAYGAAHGFDAFVPARRGVHTVCVTAYNQGYYGAWQTLGCRSAGQPY